MEGWIKIYRKLCQWEWYNISEMVHLFIHLLLNANREQGEWRGVKIERGQILTGLNSLHKETNISYQTLRTCLKRLERTNEINIQSTNKYSIITICNFESYQGVQSPTNNQSNKELTINQQATNIQLTTNKKEETEDTKKKKRTNKEFIPPSLEDVMIYFQQNKYKTDAGKKAWMSYDVANWIDSKGNPILNWKQKMINVWFTPQNKEQSQQMP
jgi:hypothetical protein